MQSNDFDVRAARERLGMSTEALAAELAATEGEVRAWESGSLRIPRHARRTLEYMVAYADWAAGMAASGLPECEWLAARRGTIVHSLSPEEVTQVARTLSAHLKGCEVCTARDQWAGANLPPPPVAPMGGTVGFFRAVGDGVARLPAWARPAAWGALAATAITALRIATMLPWKAREPHDALMAVGVVLVAGAAGAVGGLAFTLTRPPLKRLGAPGDYLGGVVTVATFMGAGLAMLRFIDAEALPFDMTSAIIFGFVSILFGTPVGKMINDAERMNAAFD